MSLETQRWAYKQNVPYKAKFVLTTLADQADEVTGEVCYQRTDVKFFVKKLCMPERSFYRCVAALVRQGYLRRESERGQQPKYWLCMKREPTSIEKWSWGAGENYPTDDERETQDIEGVCQDGRAESYDEVCHGSQTPLPLVAEQDSLEKNQRDQRVRAEKPMGGFSRDAQDVESRRLGKIAAAADLVTPKVFVIEGSRAWHAWIAYRKENRPNREPAKSARAWRVCRQNRMVFAEPISAHQLINRASQQPHDRRGSRDELIKTQVKQCR